MFIYTVNCKRAMVTFVRGVYGIDDFQRHYSFYSDLYSARPVARDLLKRRERQRKKGGRTEKARKSRWICARMRKESFNTVENLTWICPYLRTYVPDPFIPFKETRSRANTSALTESPFGSRRICGERDTGFGKARHSLSLSVFLPFV